MTRPILLTHWGAYEAEVDNGRLVALAPMPGDAEPSLIGQSVAGTLDDDLRIRQPMVRQGWLRDGAASRGMRGQEPFVPVTWEQANALVASELRRVVSAHGNRAVFGGSYGWASAGRFHHAQSQLHRFLNCAGGYTRSVNTHSYAAAEVLLPRILGNQDGLVRAHSDWAEIAAHTRLMVAFGGLPLKNTQVAAGGVGRHGVRAALLACRAAGVEFLNISPIRGDAPPELGAEWLPIRPNTDTALMLALSHTLVAEGLHDADFLARCCTGFDRVRDYLLTRDAEWAADICGIPAEAIRALARRMAATRTMISVAWALQRADHGEQPLWAAITLACLLGQVGLPGGGFGFGYGGSNRIGLASHGITWPSLPQGENPVPNFIPVARVADMLLQPGATFTYDGGTHRYPDIRLVWWAGGNPFHHQSDLNRLVEAWRRPETVVVQEAWWNPMARHADIILPCTTPAERNDIGIAGDEAHLFAMKRMVAPVGEARSDHAILTGIAAELGLEQAFTEGLDEMAWLRRMYSEARQRAAAHALDLPDFPEFWARGDIRLPPPAAGRTLFADLRAGAKLATPSGKIELYSETIESFGLPDCPGHAQWIAPTEWLGDAAPEALHLISNQPRLRLHSQLDQGRASRAGKVAGREAIWLHPADAAARGIAAGDVVRVFNARGECLAGAVLTDSVAPGVVQLPTGAWYDPEQPGGLDRHGNPNVLTLDKGTSGLAQGPSAHSALVRVERFVGTPPAMQAFTPPVLA